MKTTKLIASILILNTGGVILLVNLNTFGHTDWYQKVGAAIASTMLSAIPANNGINLLCVMCKCCKQCHDRRCSCDCEDRECGKDHLTRTLTQTDFEAMNVGDEFNIEDRQANILYFVFITMTYSGGLPVLYPIASVYFFVAYWIDKILLINYYRGPPQFNESMVKEIIYTFKWATILHLVVTIFMYKDPKIMEAYPKVTTGHKYKLYMFIVGAFLAVRLFWVYLINPCRACYLKHYTTITAKSKNV